MQSRMFSRERNGLGTAALWSFAAFSLAALSGATARANTILANDDHVLVLNAVYCLQFVPGNTHAIDPTLTGFINGVNNRENTVSAEAESELDISTVPSAHYSLATLHLSLADNMGAFTLAGHYTQFDPTFTQSAVSELVSITVGAATAALSGTSATLNLLALPGFEAGLAAGDPIRIAWSERLDFNADVSGYRTSMLGAGQHTYTLRQTSSGPLTANFEFAYAASSVPEPSSFALMAAGLLAALALRNWRPRHGASGSMSTIDSRR